MGQGNIIGKPNTPATVGAKGVWSLREQYLANRSGTWPGYDPQWSNTNFLLKTALPAGDTFIDSSPNAFTVTRNGDAIQNTSTPYAPYWSCQFDGAGDYIQAPSTTTLNFGTADFTVEAWINLRVASGGQSIIAGTAGGCFGFRYGTTWNGAANGLSIYKGSTADCENATFAFVPNRWYHVAVSRQSGTVRFFVDGTQLTTAGSGYNGYNVPVENNVRIGTSDVANSEHFNGHISNVRVTKSALYTASFTPPTAPLTAGANTTLLACQDNRFISNGTTSLTFTRTGEAAVSQFSPFAWTWSAASGGSGYFDGSGDYLIVGPSSLLAPGSGDFTLECWINIAAPNDSPIMESRSTNFATTGFTLTALNSTVIRIFTSSAILSATVPNYAGSWTHVAVVKNGTTTTLYVNGVSGGTTTSLGNLTDTELIVGGGRYAGSTQITHSFPGYIANFRVVKGLAVYTAPFTPPAAPVTAVSGTSLLLNFTNPATFDTSGSAAIVRRVGNVSRGTAAPATDLTSVGLGGSGDYLTAAAPSGQLGVGDFTVEAWVFPTARTGTYPTIWCNYSTWTTGSFGLFAGHNSYQTKYTVGVDGAFPALVSTSDIAYGQWAHLAVVRSNGVIRLYVNGTSEGGTYASSAAQNQGNGSSFIGVPGDAVSGNTFTGLISNLRVERSARYTANFTPSRSAHTAAANAVLELNQTVDTWDATAKNNITTTGTTIPTPAMFTGSALSFNGSQLARAHGALSTSFGFGTGDFTIEAWIFPTAVTGADRCLWDTRASAGDAGMVVFIDGNGKLSNYTSNAIRLTSTPSLIANTWQHVAVVRRAGTLAYFINGQPAGSVAYGSAVDCPGQVNIGIRFDNAAGFSGHMDELRVSKVARYIGTFLPSYDPFAQDWEPFYNDTLSGANVLQLKTIDLAGATNNVFRDDSPNNLPVTRNGDVAQGSPSPFIPYGYWSAYFDGSGDRLGLSANAALNPGGGDFTFECWVNPANWSGNSAALYVNLVNTGLWIGKLGANFVVRSAYVADLLQCATLPKVGAWTHVAVVRSGTTLSLFYNGTRVATATNSTTFVQGPVWIGDDGDGSSYLTGYISNLRLVKGTAVYDPTKTSLSVPNRLTAIANTTLLTCQDNRFIDKSTNNFTITRTGEVAITRFAPFPFGVSAVTSSTTNPGSVYFDGSGDFLSAPNAAANFTNQNFTAECWQWFTTNSIGYQPIMGNTGTSDYQGWIVTTETNNLVYCYISTNGANWTHSLGAVYQPPINAWVHFALVRNGATVTLYANGASIGSTNIGTAAIHSPTGAFYAGYYPFYPGGARSLTGHMSNIRLVNGTAVYTSNFTAPTAPLTAIANTSLLIAQDANAITTDASANRYTITRGGDARGNDRSPFIAPKRVTFPYGGSTYFDGSGDYLTVGGATTANFPSGNDAYCLEAWIYPVSIGQGTIIGWGDYGSGNKVTALRLSNNEAGRGHEILNYWWGNDLYSSTTNAISLNVWQHVAATFDGTTRRLFVNGVLVGSDTPTGHNVTNTSNVAIGARSTGAEPFNGYISNLRVVKGSAVYTSAFTPPGSPVDAISGTSLLTNFDNSGIYDGGGQHVLNTAGTASSTTSQRKHELASVYFDGTSGGFIGVPHPSQLLGLGTGDFTIEFWAYRTVTAQQIFYGHRPPGTQGVYPVIYCEGATLFYYVSGGNQINGGTLATGQWYHIAVSRAASQTRMFVDGTQVGGIYADTNNYLNPTGRPMIGGNEFSSTNNTAPDYRYTGHIEGLRVSRVGRYVANFTVPSEPFPVA